MRNPTPSETARRDALVRLVHTAWRDIRKRKPELDEADYRAVLRRATGGALDSCEGMSLAQLDAVMKLLRAKPFSFRIRHKTRAPAKAKPARSRALDLDVQARKVRALWLDLYERGAVRDPNESALAAYVRRQTGRDALQWLKAEELSGLIEALKLWQLRVIGEGVLLCFDCGEMFRPTEAGARTIGRGGEVFHCPGGRPVHWQPKSP